MEVLLKFIIPVLTFAAYFLAGYLLGMNKHKAKTQGALYDGHIYYLIGREHWKYNIKEDYFTQIVGPSK